MLSEIIEYQTYKVGLHGKIFVQRNGDWLLSKNVTSGDILKAREDRLIAEEKKEKAEAARRNARANNH